MIRTTSPILILLAALLGPALIGGCSSDDTPTDPGGGGGVDGLGTISGVVHRGGGLPQSGASVTAAGISSTTNEEGYFVLPRVPEGEVLVRFAASGYTTTYRAVSLAEGGSIHLPDVVLASFTTTIFQADDGGTVTSAGGGSVEIPPGSLMNGATPYSGFVYASLTVMQPQNADFYGAFPGLYRGERDDTSEVSFESFGFLNVELRSSGGSLLTLAPGATAALRLSLAGAWAARAPAAIPTWRFDEEAGRWLEEGVATLAGNVYSTLVTRLGIWNWDLPLDDLCSIAGFVVNDSGQPVVGARVISRGVDHRFLAEVRSNADGRFVVGAVQNSLTDIWAMSGSLVGESLRVSVGNECPEAAGEPLVVTVPAYSIALTWGEEPADVDSHLLIPMVWDPSYDYYHIAYFNLGTLGDYPYAQLDTDDTDSYGPEIITGTRVFPGRFQYWVHDFSGDDTEALAASGALVQLELGGSLYLFEVGDVPLEGADPDGWWHVFDIEVGGSAIDVRSVMRFEPEFSQEGVYDNDPAKSAAAKAIPARRH